jgi:glycosyltransferase involved in cell wall biosynthesis
MERVLIIASLASSLVRFRGDLIRSLRAEGHEVIACAPDLDAATLKELDQLGVACLPVRLARAGLNPFADLGYLRSLRQIITESRPGIVLAYTPKPVIYSGIALRAAPSPRHYALISGLGYGFGQETLRQRMLTPLLARMFRYGLRRSAGVIFQNPDDRALFIQRGIVASEQTMLVSGSGVDVSRFAVQPLPPQPTFLLMARLIAQKGVREYVAAARQVRARVPQARFLLAGWIELRSGAIQASELEQWRRENIVEYLGALDDVRPAIARAGVYVLPSYYREGVPRSVLEAMAMGRAVITTDTPGCRETVVDGENGLLVPARNVGELAQAMHRLAIAENVVARMGEASRRLAEERFAVEKVNAQMMTAMGLRS